MILYLEGEVLFFIFLLLLATLFFIISYKAEVWVFSFLSAMVMFVLLLELQDNAILVLVFIGVIIFLIIFGFTIIKKQKGRN